MPAKNWREYLSLDDIKSYMKNQKEGSTFVIAAFKGGLPQHAFNGVVKNGKVYFPDFQKNWYWNEMGGKSLSNFFSKYRILKTN